MKVRLKREGKINLGGKQYRKGDVFEIDNINDLPENWVEPVRNINKVEEPKKIIKEEKLDGFNKNSNKNVGR